MGHRYTNDLKDECAALDDDERFHMLTEAECDRITISYQTLSDILNSPRFFARSPFYVS